ncbi:MAG: 3-oxoacyl-ACP synthase, partial [Bdellovibrionales bacterium]|nr:3-oxoacyl-ACP synthase [Bdellovibrionales bacterium]
MQIFSRITGVGSAAPERVVTNEHFASYLDTSDEWIRERTGIEARRWCEPDVSASQLAEPA